MTTTFNDGTPVDLSDYLKTLAKHWLVILILAILGVAAGYGIARTTPPSYRAQASVLVYSQKGDNTSELVQGSTFAQNMVTSYAALATTPAVLNPAIESLGLNTTAQDLARTVTADVPLNTVIIQIGVTGTSATEVARVADAIANSLGDAVHTLSPKGLKGASTVTAQPVAPAPVPAHPYAPNANLMMGTGLAAGLALGIIFALIRGARTQRLSPAKTAAPVSSKREGPSLDAGRSGTLPAASAETAGSEKTDTSAVPAVATSSAVANAPDPVDDVQAHPADPTGTDETSPEEKGTENTSNLGADAKHERALHVVESDDEFADASDAEALRPKSAR